MLGGWFVGLVLAVVGAAAPAASAEGFATSAQASVLVCGGSMMNKDHFADSVLPAMRAHYAGRTRIALVLHASHPTERDAMELRLQKAFAHLLGDTVKAESLHRRDAAGARELLQTADAFFVGGGETFVLLGELQRTGQLELMRERVLAGVPYGGSSAGANVAGLRIGTTNDFPTAEVVRRSAIGVFPAVINPHFPPMTPETKADYDSRVGKLKTYLKFNPAETVLAVGNASIARLHAGRVEIMCGTAWLYSAAAVRALPVGEVVTGFGL
jgi:dipeptidase E